VKPSSDITSFFHRISDLPLYRELEKNIAGGGGHSYCGLNLSLASIIISTLWQNLKTPFVCAANNPSLAENTYNTVFNLFTDNIYYFPDRGESDSPVLGFSQEWERYQAELLQNLSTKFNGIIFTTQPALDTPLVPKDKVDGFSLSVGVKQNTKEMVETLAEWGYEQVDHVHTPKSFSVRGGIVDVFTLSAGLPTRIEFFGNEIESLRSFNPLSQRTVQTLSIYEILPPPTAPTDKLVPLSEVLPNKFTFIELTENSGEITIHINGGGQVDHIICQTNSFAHHSWETKKAVVERAAEQLGHEHLFLLFSTLEQRTILEKRFGPNFLLLQLPLQQGFVLPEYNLACFTYGELFQVSTKPRRQWAGITGGSTHKPIGSLDSLDWGDLLVHQDFGVGLYRGLKQIKGKTVVQECIRIEFADNGTVYVPIDKFSRVHKYISAGESNPKLSQLGTSHWERQKLKTRNSAAAVVKELIDLYAQRSQPRGFTYQPDQELVDELKASFPYEETPDQALAIQNSLKDFEKITPMDRLICGDVGFGKTEVALRAAISVISSGYKVAFLAPTTILVNQHYLTSKNRLNPIAVRVKMLSRFRSPKEQKQIVADLASGKIDLIVGTHRLLSSDVKIPRLGLLIVDEEHRFGVRHKERIKQLRKNVDVMTLTATPIPRTLQQSLIGIRDISKIETPPKERLPIRTSIHYFNWAEIFKALRREFDRGGQAFFLHNNIETLPFYQEQIQNYFPEKSIAIASGQMNSRLLETTMLDFFDGKIDLLVCTTIIESGLDIANVNTVIIDDAQRFGLAQTYQIRGRVGRSNRQAYCLLVIPKKLKLSQKAYQRLKAIEFYSNLGSGYDIALKDLEIRGAGNLFGFEQSGQISTVGFELYCKILKDAIDDALGNQKKELVSARIIFGGEALFPAEYMSIVQDRLLFYQKLVAADTLESLNQIVEEIRDRYGRFPEEVRNLFTVSRLRILSIGSGLSTLNIDSELISGTVTQNTRFHDPVEMMSSLETLLKSMGRPYRFSVNKHNQFSFELNSETLILSKKFGLQIVKLFSKTIED